MHRLSALCLTLLIFSSSTQSISNNNHRDVHVKADYSQESITESGTLLNRVSKLKLKKKAQDSYYGQNHGILEALVYHGQNRLSRFKRKASKANISRSYREMLRQDYSQEQYKFADFPKNWKILKVGLKRLKNNITLTKSELKELEKNITNLIAQGDGLSHENRSASQLNDTHKRFRAFLKHANFILPDLALEVQIQTEMKDDIAAEIETVRNILLRQHAYQVARAEAETEVQSVNHKIGGKEHNSSRSALSGKYAAFSNLVEKYLTSTASRDSHHAVNEIDALTDFIEPFEDPELRRADRLIDDALHHRKAFSEDEIHHRKLRLHHTPHHVAKRSENRILHRTKRKSPSRIRKGRRNRLSSAVYAKRHGKAERYFLPISDDPRLRTEPKVIPEYWSDEDAINALILHHEGPRLEHPFLLHRRAHIGHRRDIHSLVDMYIRNHKHSTFDHDFAKLYLDRDENDIGKTHNTLQNLRDRIAVKTREYYMMDPFILHRRAHLGHKRDIHSLIDMYLRNPKHSTFDHDLAKLYLHRDENDIGKTLDTLPNLRDRIAVKARELYMMDPDITNHYGLLRSDLITTKDLRKLSNTVGRLVSKQQQEELEWSPNIAKVWEGALGYRPHDELRNLNMRIHDLREASLARKLLRPHKKALQKKINRAIDRNLRKLYRFQKKRYKYYLRGTKEAWKYRAKLVKSRIRDLTRQLMKARRGKDIEDKRLRILLVQHQLEDLLGSGEGVVDVPTGFLTFHYDDPYFDKDFLPSLMPYRSTRPVYGNYMAT